jgi:hypothetical protein
VCKVDVTANLVFTVLIIANKDNGCHAAISHQFFSFGEGKQEWAVIDLAASM